MNTPKNLFYVLGEWWEGRQARDRSSTSVIPSRKTRWLPSPGNVLFTLLMIGLLLWAQSAGAIPLPRLPENVTSSTNTIAYQGRLADAAGAPLTGTYNIIFRLYSAFSGGVPLWEEQWTGQNGVHVSDGLFNVMLGSLTPIPQNIFTGNNTLWLGITVGTDDEMAPRVQLGNVPFAVQALTVPDGSVATAKIADQAVTQAKLGPDVNLVPPDGSITTAKLADSAVTPEKVSSLYEGYGAWLNEQIVTGPGWLELTDPNYHRATVTVLSPSVLDASISGLVWADGNQRGVLCLVVDGNDNICVYNQSTQPTSLAIRRLIQVEAGSHWIGARIGSWDSTQAHIAGPFALDVMVFGR